MSQRPRGAAFPYHAKQSSISSESSSATSGWQPNPPVEEPRGLGERPDVVVRFISNKVGLGVFAGRNFARGELIFQERAAMVATHDPLPSAHGRDAPSVYKGMSPGERSLMLAAFQELAPGENAGASMAWAPLPHIGSRLRQPAVATVQVTMDQHMSLRSPCSRLWRRGAPARDSKVLRWFAAYAFRLPESEGRHQAAVFLIGSLINHSCAGWEANFNLEGDELRVIARKDVKEGDELRINYGKAKKGFACVCEQCRVGRGNRTRLGRLPSLRAAASKAQPGK